MLAALVAAGCGGPPADVLEVPILHSTMGATYEGTGSAQMQVAIKPAQVWLRNGTRADGFELALLREGAPASAFLYDGCLQPLARLEHRSSPVLYDRIDFRMLLDPPPPLLPLSGRMLRGSPLDPEPLRKGLTTSGAGSISYGWGEDRVVANARVDADEVASLLYPADLARPPVPPLHRWFMLLRYDDQGRLPAAITWEKSNDTEHWKRLTETLAGETVVALDCIPSPVAGQTLKTTRRGTSTDPPFAYRLSEAVEAAESSPTALDLAQFLQSHPDAYLRRWSIAPTGAGPRWTLTYAATSSPATVEVACVLIGSAAPPDQQSLASTCSDEPKTEGPLGNLEFGRSASPYQAWTQVFTTVFGGPANEGTFQFVREGRLRGELAAQEGSIWDRIRFDATAGFLTEIEGNLTN